MDTVMGLEPEQCPVDRTLRIIAGRWKSLIIYYLRGGPRRFNELRRMMPGVTQRMLTQHLRELEADGVIDRTVFPVVPPHVEYALSEIGMSLLPVMDAMAKWGAARASVDVDRTAAA
ncbi:MAG: transcriptional regulator [Rhodobacterales bacterium 17-64-5]|nr:MAG: transcriptional regulator [Rhodobacterales bacterium 12-65-15]OZA10162.1 MAG: transcriptional regulator [Rhodobacterales bacterium 17-64-5]